MLNEKMKMATLSLISLLSFGCSANNGLTVPTTQSVIQDSSNFSVKVAAVPSQAPQPKSSVAPSGAPAKGNMAPPPPPVKPLQSPQPGTSAPSAAPSGNMAPPPPPPAINGAKPAQAPQPNSSTAPSGAPVAGKMSPPPPPPVMGGVKPTRSPQPSSSIIPQPVVTASPVTESAKFTVTISGGYETNPVDHGRPVILIASALGVPAEVFRSAFSLVTPASGGQEPDPVQVGLNKAALLSILGTYGITNDFLDNVSDYYRYSGVQGQVWQRTPATATAIVTNGEVTGINIINHGAGYSSVPTVTISGVNGITAKAVVSYTKDFTTNGSISSIILSK